MKTPDIQAYGFVLFVGLSGNLICIHLRAPDEVVPSNETMLMSLPAFCLLVLFYIPAISSALGEKLDIHNDQMNLQIAYLRLSSPGCGRDWSVGVHEGKSSGERAVLWHLCCR